MCSIFRTKYNGDENSKTDGKIEYHVDRDPDIDFSLTHDASNILQNFTGLIDEGEIYEKQDLGTTTDSPVELTTKTEPDDQNQDTTKTPPKTTPKPIQNAQNPNPKIQKSKIEDEPNSSVQVLGLFIKIMLVGFILILVVLISMKIYKKKQYQKFENETNEFTMNMHGF